VVNGCSAIGLKAITMYAFSEQNWARPEDEVGGLMRLIVEFLIAERETAAFFEEVAKGRDAKAAANFMADELQNELGKDVVILK